MKLVGGIEVLVLSGVHTVGKCILWGNLLTNELFSRSWHPPRRKCCYFNPPEFGFRRWLIYPYDIFIPCQHIIELQFVFACCESSSIKPETHEDSWPLTGHTRPWFQLVLVVWLPSGQILLSPCKLGRRLCSTWQCCESRVYRPHTP